MTYHIVVAGCPSCGNVIEAEKAREWGGCHCGFPYSDMDLWEKSMEKTGKKDDKYKDRDDVFFTAFAKPIDLIIKVSTKGGRKYGQYNFMDLDKPIKRCTAALSRHVRKHFEGEFINKEDFGLPHLAHAAWCCLALMFFILRDGKEETYINDLLEPEEPVNDE